MNNYYLICWKSRVYLFYFSSRLVAMAMTFYILTGVSLTYHNLFFIFMYKYIQFK